MLGWSWLGTNLNFIHEDMVQVARMTSAVWGVHCTSSTLYGFCHFLWVPILIVDVEQRSCNWMWMRTMKMQHLWSGNSTTLCTIECIKIWPKGMITKMWLWYTAYCMDLELWVLDEYTRKMFTNITLTLLALDISATKLPSVVSLLNMST